MRRALFRPPVAPAVAALDEPALGDSTGPMGPGGDPHPDGRRGASVDDGFGYGPLEPLVADAEVTGIMVNGPDEVYAERGGVVSGVEITFRDGAHIRAVIDRLLANSGRCLDGAAPMVDARLADGSRINAILPPVALKGPVLTIRRVSRRRRAIGDLVEAGALDGRMAAFLHAAVLGRCNVVVTGGGGSGKTTLMAALCGLVPAGQRIVTLEDVAELAIDHPHVVAQECCPVAGDGFAQISLRDLVRNSLHMRPDRIVVGEVRGVEAADMIRAMNAGYEGSMTTVHANSAEDGLDRLEAMLAQACPTLAISTVRRRIAAAVDVVVHCERAETGHRYIDTVAACTADETGALRAVPVFRAHGEAGDFTSCGEVPTTCLERMARHGVRFPASLFAAA